jgi:hypothetical protein
MTTKPAAAWRDEDVRGFGMCVGGPARGQFESEVGSPGEAARMLGHQLHPARRLEQERQRAHQDGLAAGHQR